MQALLAWIGARARWTLGIGVIAALGLPELAVAMTPLIPALVVILLALAFCRIDLIGVARAAVGPRRLARSLGLSLALTVATPMAVFAIARLFGASDAAVAALVYIAAAPPVGSAPALCMMLGFDAALALEAMLISGALTPLIAPMLTDWLLSGGAGFSGAEIDGAAMGLNLAVMMALSVAAALALRGGLGAGWIAARAQAFDGLSAILLLVIVVPLFAGVAGAAAADLQGVLIAAGLVFAMNWGAQAIAAGISWGVGAEPQKTGAVAVIWGNRNAAMMLGALPPDPVFAMYVALYQLPMYLTPLITGAAARLLSRRVGPRGP